MPRRRVLIARCVDCGRPRWDRFLRCKRCQKLRFSAAMEQSWRRRKRHAQIIREVQPESRRGPVDIDALMAEADAVSARVLNAALKLSKPDR
jgi:hypothetical protein